MLHLPVGCLFQCESVDLVEYKTSLLALNGTRCTCLLPVMDHLTRFAVLIPLPNKKERTVAKALISRLFGIFGPPETLYSDQGLEFENNVISQLRV